VLTSAMTSTDVTGTDWATFANCDSSHYDSRFVNDGYEDYAGAFSTLTADNYLMTDYSYAPATDPGPEAATSGQCNSGYWSPYFDPAHGPIDWTHGNSVTASKPGADEFLLLSLYQWDQIVRINASTGAKLWSLSYEPGYSTLSLVLGSGLSGDTKFKHQHAAYEQDGYIQFFDNEGQTSGSRVLRLTLSGGPPTTTATIVKSWPVVNAAGNGAEACPGRGNGITVPNTSGNSVLAMCSQEHLVEELNDSDGQPSAPAPRRVELPDSGFCSSGGPGTVSGIKGWYRAFPLINLGEF
jgi:hypothetical protein